MNETNATTNWRIAMRNNLTTMMALVAIFAAFTALTGCNGNDTEIEGVTALITFKAEACKAEENKPEDCTEFRFCLNGKSDDDVNGKGSTKCGDVDLTEGTDEITLKLSEAGNYLPSLDNDDKDVTFPESNVIFRLNSIEATNGLRFDRGLNVLVVNFEASADNMSATPIDYERIIDGVVEGTKVDPEEIIDALDNRTGSFSLSFEDVDGNAVSDCSTIFNLSRLNEPEACTVTDGVMTCESVPTATYTVDATCDDGNGVTLQKEDYVFTVTGHGQTDHYTVVVKEVEEDINNPVRTTGSARLHPVNEDGEAVNDCDFSFNPSQLNADCTVDSEMASCTDITVGTYSVNLACGTLVAVGFSFDITPSDVVADYTILVKTPGGDVNPLPVTGSVDLSVRHEDGRNAVPTDCLLTFNADQLNTDCTVDNDMASCTNILVGGYTVDVSCENGAFVNEGYFFSVLAGETTAYTVVVRAPNTGGPDGTGFGDVTITASNDEVTPVDCVFVLDTEFDANCTFDTDSATCTHIPEGNYTGSVSCNDGSLVAEEFGFSVNEDVNTDVVVTLEDLTPTTGSLLAHVVDPQGNPLSACTSNFVGLDPDPTSSSPADGDYHFDTVEAGTYGLLITCDGSDAEATITIVAGEETEETFTTTPEDLSKGTLCVGQLGIPIDQVNPTAVIQEWIGIVAVSPDGIVFCDIGALDSTDYAVIELVDYYAYREVDRPAYCESMSHPDCIISPLGTSAEVVNGVYQHLEFSGDISALPLEDGEWHTFAVVLSYYGQVVPAYLGLTNDISL